MVTGDHTVDRAVHIALRTMLKSLRHDAFVAGTGYPAPWFRDTFDLGVIPNTSLDVLSAYPRALAFWAGIQGREPVYKWGGEFDRCEPGQISSNLKSGYYDETFMFIPAVLESYRVTGDRGYLSLVENCREAWAFGSRHVPMRTASAGTSGLSSTRRPSRGT